MNGDFPSHSTTASLPLHLHGRHASAEFELEPLPTENLEPFGRDVGVHLGQNPRQILEHGHVRAEAIPHRTEFETDRAGADDGEPLGDFGVLQRFGAGADDLAVDLDAAKVRRLASSGDDDVLGLNLALFAARRRHLNPIGREQLSVAAKDLDLVLAHQPIHALSERFDDLRFPSHHRGEVGPHAVELDAVLGELRFGGVINLARFEQRFAGNAADAKTRAAEQRFLFDDRRLQPQLGAANRRDISAGAGPDDHEIERVFRHVSCRVRSRPSAAEVGPLYGIAVF